MKRIRKGGTAPTIGPPAAVFDVNHALDGLYASRDRAVRALFATSPDLRSQAASDAARLRGLTQACYAFANAEGDAKARAERAEAALKKARATIRKLRADLKRR